jgi:hypothetical protein
VPFVWGQQTHAQAFPVVTALVVELVDAAPASTKVPVVSVSCQGAAPTMKPVRAVADSETEPLGTHRVSLAPVKVLPPFIVTEHQSR